MLLKHLVVTTYITMNILMPKVQMCRGGVVGGHINTFTLLTFG